MTYGFLSQRDLPDRTLNHLPHKLLPVESRPRLLVLVDENLNLLQQLPIHQLVFSN